MRRWPGSRRSRCWRTPASSHPPRPARARAGAKVTARPRRDRGGRDPARRDPARRDGGGPGEADPGEAGSGGAAGTASRDRTAGRDRAASAPPRAGRQPDGERCPGDGPAVPREAVRVQGRGLGGQWTAPVLDPAQLRGLGEDLIYRADPDGVEERERKRFERRHLSFGLTLDDTGTLSGACGDTLSRRSSKPPCTRSARRWARGHPDRRPAPDGRPDRRLPGRPELRHRPAPGTAPPPT